MAAVALASTVAMAHPAWAEAFKPIAAIGGTGVGRLGIPLGVAVEGGGVYVSEHVNQRVGQFGTGGTFIRGWGFDVRQGGGKRFEVCARAARCKPGSPGGRAGQLGFPGGIAADESGGVYVTDPANDRVSQFTASGAFVRAFGFDVIPGGRKRFEVCTRATRCKRGIAGARAGQLDRPSYVASDGAGSIYVTDIANNRVNQFTTEGAFVRAWGFNVRPGGGRGFEVCTRATGCRRGKAGGRAGQMSAPNGIAADGEGNVYVADSGNQRVSQFTADAAFVRAWGIDVAPDGRRRFEICTRATRCKRGVAGGRAGQLGFTLGLGVDPAGNVYVADSGNRRVSQFTAEGAFVRAFGRDVAPGGDEGFEVCTRASRCKRGERGRGDRVLLNPSAVAAGPGGSIYVADAEAGRILCLGEAGSMPCVRNLLRLGGLKRDRRRGTAKLAVKVPGPGNVRVRGKRIKRAGVRPKAAGTVRLPIRPRRRTRRVLGREGEARVRIRTTYRPVGGAPNAKVRRVELVKRRR